MGLTKKQLKDAEAAVSYFSKIGKKEGWLKQKDIDEAKQTIKVMKGGRRKSKKSRSRRGGAGLGENCKSDDSCDGDLICDPDSEKCVESSGGGGSKVDGSSSSGSSPSLGEVASILQEASDNAGIPSDFQMGADDIPNKGGTNPHANDRGAQVVNNVLNRIQTLIHDGNGRNDNFIRALIIAQMGGNTEMMRVFLDRQEKREQREHEFKMARLAAQERQVANVVSTNANVARKRDETQLALYNASQRTNRMNTNFHMGLQFFILGIVITIAVLGYNTGDVFAQMFRDIDRGIGQRLSITVPSMDADGASWLTMGIPHLINLFVAILQGAVDLVGFFTGALTQFLATLAALGPAGIAAGIIFLGILFMIAVYFLMNIRRARGFFAIGGIDLSVGEQQGAQALPQLGPAPQQQTQGILTDTPVTARVEGMIRYGQGRITNREETLMLENQDESSASGSEGTKGGRRRTRRRRRKNKKTKRKKRRGRRKSKRRRRRRKSRR